MKPEHLCSFHILLLQDSKAYCMWPQHAMINPISRSFIFIIYVPWAFFQILFFFQKCARQFDNFHSLDGGIFIGILGSQKYHHTPYGLSGEHKKVSGNGTMAGIRSSKRVRRGTSAFDLCPLFLAISRQKKKGRGNSL